MGSLVEEDVLEIDNADDIITAFFIYGLIGDIC